MKGNGRKSICVYFSLSFTMRRERLHYWESFRKTCDEFSKNSSLTCYKYLSSTNSVERYLWWIVHLSSTMAIIYLVNYSWNEFMTHPTVTSVESLTYPITNVPFPGISVCNINKISRKRAKLFAKEMASKSGISEDIFFNDTIFFGNLYDYSSALRDEENLIKFQNLLETYDLNNERGGFDLHGRLKQLTTPCSDLISNCFWAGNRRNCKDLFVMGTTMEGFCCIFNYVPLRKSNHILTKVIKENKNRELLTPDSGRMMGLSVTILNEPDDYLYPLISTVGANVHIFNPNDFPDTTSGGLIEKLVPIGNEVFIRLSSSTIYTVPEAMDYSIGKRKCIFRSETRTILGSYSYSDCIVDCKIKSIIALCQCVPFNLINVIDHDHYTTCSLSDLVCIDKYKDKWRTLNPLDYEGDELDREKQDSLRCDHCVPTCSDTLYGVRNEYSEVVTGDGSNITSKHSVLHIFFEKPYGVLNKQDVLYTWYDIVSSFGGLCSLIIGISLISAIEFVYFFTIRFYKNLFSH